MLVLWSVYVSPFNSVINWGILFFLAISSLNVYPIMLSGWSSNSKYALLGRVRAVAQTISYEIRIALIIICVMIMGCTFNFLDISNNGVTALIIPFILVMWFVSRLAETNRAPFDLAEGESELVSGFNIEYGGAMFAFLFIAEYGSILLMRLITRVLFFSGVFYSLGIFGVIKTILVAFVFLWVRGSYPRMRYDSLMSLTWKTFLRISLCVSIIMFVA